MIAYFASDLIWATRIKSAAEAMSIPARPVRTVEMLEARLADSDVRGLIVDLDHPDIALPLIERVRRGGGSESGRGGSAIRVAAFGPHVETEVLQRAKEAGADLVLTRGAFHHGMSEVLRRLNE